MRQATLDDLIDESWGSPYCTEGFDYPRAMARVAALREPLERLTGRPFRQDCGVQDASYFTELYAPDPPIPSPGGGGAMSIQCFAHVPFSYFGEFFTVYGSSLLRPLSDELRLSIAELVSEHGFLYVPREILSDHLWIRFFDYL